MQQIGLNRCAVVVIVAACAMAFVFDVQAMMLKIPKKLLTTELCNTKRSYVMDRATAARKLGLAQVATFSQEDLKIICYVAKRYCRPTESIGWPEEAKEQMEIITNAHEALKPYASDVGMDREMLKKIVRETRVAHKFWGIRQLWITRVETMSLKE